MTTTNTQQKTTGRLLDTETRLRITSWVLITAGCIDLIRGFMHTFNIQYAAANIARVDIASPMIGDFLQVMSAFGISNFLTGAFAIIVALKAKHLAPLFVAIIPATYALGIVSIRLNAIESTAAFNGQYMILVYMSICILTALYYYIPKWLGLDKE